MSLTRTTPDCSEPVCVTGICCELCTIYTVRGTVYHTKRKNNGQCPVWICTDCRERVIAGTPMRVEEL